ncbi:hypothetical protein [Paenibacillus soyae]|uniref:Uncharacterized protein n=1 Tax=Paenibacillus soyae TaxID=2969249 RepID=A0A9X2MS26_9BACL|nr:hypothetical protein [Paenibacillus soyae]MCR2805320.1 hypothetical protein [Paenibacillus soyae]
MPFSDLITRGTSLHGLPVDDPEVQKWITDCSSSIRGRFEEKRQGKPIELVTFRKASFHEGKLSVLKALQDKAIQKSIKASLITVNQEVKQIQSVHTELINQVHLAIEYSDLTEEEKAAAMDLVEQVKEEVQKPTTNWEKVTNLLRRSFDYGLKIAPDIVKLADAYFRSRGGK